jgi:hypothetical protein
LKQLFALFGSREYPICFGSSIRPIFETPTHASTALINNLLIVFFEFLAVDPKGRPLLVVDLKGRPIVSVDVGDAGFSKVDFGEAGRSAVDDILRLLDTGGDIFLIEGIELRLFIYITHNIYNINE